MASNQPPSPSPSTQPPAAAGAKRPRASAAAAPRAKRRRPEGSAGPDSVASDERALGPSKIRPSFGVGMVKGKEDEWSDPADVRNKCKIDFMDLPLETLYRYLEAHDLLPRWDVSPWSEDRVVPPSQLFANLNAALRSPRRAGLDVDAAAAAAATPVDPPTATTFSTEATIAAAGPVAAAEPEVIDGPVPPTPTPTEPAPAVPAPYADVAVEPQGAPAPPPSAAADADEDAKTPPAAPTTRSKTAPLRKARTPSPEPERGERDERLTILDVERAHQVLADRANQHWMRGLGGGQNKESETIVQFLYKNKVGPGRLLRVYNPATYPFQ
ncbi:hypothetical protein Q5752_001438 [Cryptotrichosporon argae]